MRQAFNLPNLLSLARLGLTPLAVGSILNQGYRQALVIFAIAAITDALDGVLARRYGWSTKLGAYLDPIADKVLLVGVYLSLGLSNLVPWWLVAIVFGRDVLLLVLSGAALAFTGHRDFSPTMWGKLSTFVQIVTAVVVVGSRALPSATLARGPELLFVAAAAATIWSGLHYAWRARKIVRRSATNL
jgi:cardiolipin synthase